jgi:hypothetical protein
MPSSNHLSRRLFWISCICVVMLAVCVAIWFMLPSFEHARNSVSACYWTNALVVYVECRGFSGHATIQGALNLPLLMFYFPIFGVVILSGDPSSMIIGVSMFVLGVSMWLPPVYVLWYLLACRGKGRDRSI